MQFSINGTQYWVEEYDTGKWYWTADHGDSNHFASAAETQLDALQYEAQKAAEELAEEQQRAEDRFYRSYDQQVRSHHNYITRH